MKRSIFFLLFAVGLTSYLQAQISWPGGKTAAVMLTYDDACVSQLEIAIPQLDAHGFHGTFFLSGGIRLEDIAKWRDASVRGHELGNHSIHHPCLSKSYSRTEERCYHLDCYTVNEIVSEVSTMNKWIYSIDGKPVHSYAYPCCQSNAKDGDYADSLRTSGFVSYARGASINDGHVVSDLKTLDLLKVPNIGGTTGASAQKLTGIVKEAMEKGGFCVIVFHGVGGDHHITASEEHNKFLDFLKENEEKLWVGTFSEVLDYVAKIK